MFSPMGASLPDGPMPEQAQTAETLHAQAERCRRLASGITDYKVTRRLLELAEEFEGRAAAQKVKP